MTSRSASRQSIASSTSNELLAAQQTDQQVHHQAQSTQLTAPPGVFSPNPFSPLSIDMEEEMQVGAPLARAPKPPPIYIRNVINFLALTKGLQKKCKNDFTCKSRLKEVIVSTSTSDDYRAIIGYLKEKQADYHTYQLKQEKAYRVVIRNLHHTTPPTSIEEELTKNGFPTKSVFNVIHPRTKEPLPLFFVDLEPQKNNSEIFKLDVLLFSKIKVEEPKKQRTIVQCKRCQQYGHTRSYCQHSPNCVKCAGPHLTEECRKTPEASPKCVLCSGTHPANYRGCQVHKQLQKERRPQPVYNHPTAARFVQQGPPRQQQPPQMTSGNEFPSLPSQPLYQPLNQLQHQAHQPLSYSQITSGATGQHPHPIPTTDISTVLSSFLTEFKDTIKPLITLLTTVMTKLMSQIP